MECFAFELGQLKRIRHEGWRLAGIENPGSVAAHVCRSTPIGYLLAVMEKCENPHLVFTILAFHDMGECRVGDIHKVANRYCAADEEGAIKDQCDKLGYQQLLILWKEGEERTTEAGTIAKDADLLE